jgi:Protein of unknown function (DUF2530)
VPLPTFFAGARPAPQPPPVHARVVILTGTALWFAAFVVLLPFWGPLGAHSHRVWIWTCLAGWVLGLTGYAIFRRHRTEGRVE